MADEGIRREGDARAEPEAERDLTDETLGATTTGVGGATLGAIAGSAGGPAGAVIGAAIGGVVGAVTGAAAGAAVDIPGTSDTEGAGAQSLTDEQAPLDRVNRIDDRDTLDPS